MKVSDFVSFHTPLTILFYLKIRANYISFTNSFLIEIFSG
jgi:hypothetical protein